MTISEESVDNENFLVAQKLFSTCSENKETLLLICPHNVIYTLSRTGSVAMTEFTNAVSKSLSHHSNLLRTGYPSQTTSISECRTEQARNGPGLLPAEATQSSFTSSYSAYNATFDMLISLICSTLIAEPKYLCSPYPAANYTSCPFSIPRSRYP